MIFNTAYVGGGLHLGITVSPVLDENAPDIIQKVTAVGLASNYWSVGDKIGIALNGTVGALTFNDTYYAFIIGFDHNSSIEGSNTIHFQFGKTSDGTDIAFVDNYYGGAGSVTGFRMYQYDTSSVGWEGSYMRSTICPAFLSAMPTTWQNVIASCTKYSNNGGGTTISASYVTSTSDQIWLLGEYEVQGARTYANTTEQNYQKQYTYYANGNSKIKYQHSSTASTCYWWLRSAYLTVATYAVADPTYGFCAVNLSGSMSKSNNSYSYGFAPGFMVA